MLFRDIYVYDKASFLIKGKIKFGIVIISRERVSQDNDRGGNLSYYRCKNINNHIVLKLGGGHMSIYFLHKF